jgi:hypothetical protein
MHRAIAEWLTARPWRAAMASAFCGALSPQMLIPFMVLAGAIPVLTALRSNPGVGLAMAATGAVSATWMVLSLSQVAQWATAGILGLFFSPVLLGVLLKRTGSLNLCFQVAVLGAAAGLVVVHRVLPDPAAVWIEPLRNVVDSMAAAGLKLEGGDAMIDLWARTMWGALAALTLALVLGSLLLGCWWQSLLASPGQFGTEYRQLRLGRVLGLCITVLFVAAFFVESALLASLAWIAFAALSFQGLAAAHSSKARGQINRGWLAAIYVLLIVPLSMSVTVVALALWGFADNWRRPRAASAH